MATMPSDEFKRDADRIAQTSGVTRRQPPLSGRVRPRHLQMATLIEDFFGKLKE